MKAIIDTNSLITLFRYYEHITGFEDLKDFLTEQITQANVIVIDKVYEELHKYQGKGNVLDKLKITRKHTYPTEQLLTHLMKKEQEWYLRENETTNRYANNPQRIEADKRLFLDTHADLYLVALCTYIAKTHEVLLITEETLTERHNNKLYPKIPTLCKQENIKYGNITQLLFEMYKQEITITAHIHAQPSTVQETITS